jgi:hypothetical protein
MLNDAVLTKVYTMGTSSIITTPIRTWIAQNIPEITMMASTLLLKCQIGRSPKRMHLGGVICLSILNIDADTLWSNHKASRIFLPAKHTVKQEPAPKFAG